MLEQLEIDETLRETVRAETAGMHTACPAYVAKVYDGGQRIDAQPMIRATRLDADGEPATYLPAQITNVPVVWPGSAGMAATFPIRSILDVGGIAEATRVLLVFADRSLDEWLAYGVVDTDPVSKRRHNATDAIAIPALRSFNPLELLPLVPTDRARFGQYALANPTRVEVTETGGATGTGYVRIGNDTAELLDMFEQLLSALQTAFVVTSLGNQPIFYDPATPKLLSALTTSIRLLLDQIREP